MELLVPAPIRTEITNKDKTTPTWEKWFRDLVKKIANINTMIDNKNANIDYVNMGTTWRFYVKGSDLVFEHRTLETAPWVQKGIFHGA